MRIQPTYEELKLKWAFTTAKGKWSIQPTYEELKPSQKGERALALSLYPAYLWGIETL